MPAQKRNSSSSDSLLHDGGGGESLHRRKRSRRELEEGDSDRDEEEEDPEKENSDGSRSSDDLAKLSEWILVELPALRTYVKCPICLGIIKKTRTVMECLHRFCRECIDKSMRLGNNECPACRTHCASRRSLRDDPRFDELIEIIFEDIERYEQEELTFHEEDESRNKQIQDSIAQISRRQSEALVAKRKRRKDKALTNKYCDSYPRRGRNTRGMSHEGSEEDEDENNHGGNKDSSEDERREEIIKPMRYKRKAKAQPFQPSSSTVNSDFGVIENDVEASKGSKGSPLRTPEMLAWGGGGARSRSVRNTRIMKLTKYIESLKDNDDEFGVHLMLTSLDKQRTPSLQHYYLCCPPHFAVERLKEFVAQETLLPSEGFEILLVKKHASSGCPLVIPDPPALMDNKSMLQILDEKETLAGVRVNYALEQNHLADWTFL